MITIREFAMHLQLQNGFKYIGQLNSLWLSTTKFYIKDFHIFKEGANLLSFHTTLLRRRFPRTLKTSTKKMRVFMLIRGLLSFAKEQLIFSKGVSLINKLLLEN